MFVRSASRYFGLVANDSVLTLKPQSALGRVDLFSNPTDVFRAHELPYWPKFNFQVTVFHSLHDLAWNTVAKCKNFVSPEEVVARVKHATNLLVGLGKVYKQPAGRCSTNGWASRWAYSLGGFFNIPPMGLAEHVQISGTPAAYTHCRLVYATPRTARTGVAMPLRVSPIHAWTFTCNPGLCVCHVRLNVTWLSFGRFTIGKFKRTFQYVDRNVTLFVDSVLERLDFRF